MRRRVIQHQCVGAATIRRCHVGMQVERGNNGNLRADDLPDIFQNVPFDVRMAVGRQCAVQCQQHAIDRHGPLKRADHFVPQPLERLGRRPPAGPGGQPHQADDLRLLGPLTQRLDEAAQLVSLGHFARRAASPRRTPNDSKSARVVASGLSVFVSCQSWPMAMRIGEGVGSLWRASSFENRESSSAKDSRPLNSADPSICNLLYGSIEPRHASATSLGCMAAQKPWWQGAPP